MKELGSTGWLSNRGRQNVASFLTKDLRADWRVGAELFELLLIDHDVAANYAKCARTHPRTTLAPVVTTDPSLLARSRPALRCAALPCALSWQYFSGVGNDPKDRHFRTVSQGQTYDPDATFIKMWLPELSTLSVPHSHEPWLLTTQQQQQQQQEAAARTAADAAAAAGTAEAPPSPSSPPPPPPAAEGCPADYGGGATVVSYWPPLVPIATQLKYAPPVVA